jgi:hypothetical protein
MMGMAVRSGKYALSPAQSSAFKSKETCMYSFLNTAVHLRCADAAALNPTEGVHKRCQHSDGDMSGFRFRSANSNTVSCYHAAP